MDQDNKNAPSLDQSGTGQPDFVPPAPGQLFAPTVVAPVDYPVVDTAAAVAPANAAVAPPTAPAVTPTDPMATTVSAPAASQPLTVAQSTPPPATAVASPGVATTPAAEPLPYMPTTAGPVVNSAISAEAPAPKKKHHAKLFITAGVVVFLLLAGSAAAYQFVYQGPTMVWSRSMKRTVGFLHSVQASGDKYADQNYQIAGTYSTTGQYNLHGSITSVQKDSNNQTRVGLATDKSANLTAEFRVLAVKDSFFPDYYFRLDGTKQITSIFGSNAKPVADYLAPLDGQWFELSHDFLGQFASSATSDKQPQLTADDYKKIDQEMGKVIEKRILTTDMTQSIFHIDQKMGLTKYSGALTYHYKVSLDKDHLKGMVHDTYTAIKNTKLKDLMASSLANSYGEDADIKQIDATDYSKYPMEWWLDTRGFIRNIRFYDHSQSQSNDSYVDFGMPYESGSVVPFEVSGYSKTKDSEDKMTFRTDVDTSSSKIMFKINASFKAKDTTTFTAEMNMTPDAKDANVTAPTGAKDIMEFLMTTPLGQSVGGTSASITVSADSQRIADLGAIQASLEEQAGSAQGSYPPTLPTTLKTEQKVDPEGRTIHVAPAAKDLTAAKAVALDASSDYIFIPYGCSGSKCQGYVLKSKIDQPSAAVPNPYVLQNL